MNDLQTVRAAFRAAGLADGGIESFDDVRPELLWQIAEIRAQQERKPDDNARLIAAAPDMLAACLAYMRDREEVGCVADSAAVKAMRAAIAKATKETP